MILLSNYMMRMTGVLLAVVFFVMASRLLSSRFHEHRDIL